MSNWSCSPKKTEVLFGMVTLKNSKCCIYNHYKNTQDPFQTVEVSCTLWTYIPFTYTLDLKIWIYIQNIFYGPWTYIMNIHSGHTFGSFMVLFGTLWYFLVFVVICTNFLAPIMWYKQLVTIWSQITASHQWPWAASSWSSNLSSGGFVSWESGSQRFLQIVL